MLTQVRFTATFPADLQGEQWEVLLVQEGDFVDGQHSITKDALQAAQDHHLFENVYVQELQFRDGVSRHLPKDLDAAAPGGVFGNAVGIITNTALRVLASGKTAIVGIMTAIDESWKKKMRVLAEHGLRLPGLSFNAMIPATAIQERLTATGQRIKDIFNFERIDTMEIVSYPNAGGQILRCIAEDTTASSTPHLDRNPYRMQLLKLYCDRRGLPYDLEAKPKDALQAILTSDEFKTLPVSEQGILQSLMPLIENPDLADSMATLLATLSNMSVDAAPETPAETTDPSAAPAETSELAQPDTGIEATPSQIQAGVDAKTLAQLLDAKMSEFETKFETKFNQTLRDREAEMKRQERLVAGQALIQQSSLPDSVKPLALDMLKTSNETPEVIVNKFVKATAPLAEAGRVRAAVGSQLYVGANARDKKNIALIKMLGGVPRDSEKSQWNDVRPFRGLQEAYGECTGVWINRYSLRELNDVTAQRVTADIDMFTPADFPKLMDSTMNRVIVDLYGEQEQTWRKLCTVRKGCKDFRDLRINRLAGFASPLPVYSDTKTGVSTRYEGGIQLIGVPGEQELKYRPYIRASQWILSYEAMVDDDVQALQWWLKDFAIACDQTALWLVAHEVINTDANGVPNAGTMDYDSKALYHADHLNILHRPLSYEAVRDACSMIRKQRRFGADGRPLHLKPATLLVPETLHDTAEVLLTTTGEPYSSSNNSNGLNGKLEQITLDEYWLGDSEASKRNWFVLADQRQNPLVEAAFLFDQETPQILTANAPTEGLMLTHLRTVFSGVFIMGAQARGHEMAVGSFPTE